MRIHEIFDVFSRRMSSGQQATVPLSDSFRNRVLMRCRDALQPTGYLERFWREIHSTLSYLHGSPHLSRGRPASVVDDVIAFLTSCEDSHFLDFIELMFRADTFSHVFDKEHIPEDINEFLRVDQLPYAVTDYVWTTDTVEKFGRTHEATTLTEYPRVIRRDSELLYDSAIAPALVLLASDDYKAANAEFLDALEDFRRGDFGDCLTKCGSAFESVMKVICHRRKWAYREEDTAAPLLRTVIQNAGLEPFLEQPLIVVATLRNRLDVPRSRLCTAGVTVLGTLFETGMELK